MNLAVRAAASLSSVRILNSGRAEQLMEVESVNNVCFMGVHHITFTAKSDKPVARCHGQVPTTRKQPGPEGVGDSRGIASSEANHSPLYAGYFSLMARGKPGLAILQRNTMIMDTLTDEPVNGNRRSRNQVVWLSPDNGASLENGRARTAHRCIYGWGRAKPGANEIIVLAVLT